MCESDTGDGYWGERSWGNKLAGVNMTRQKAARGGVSPILSVSRRYTEELGFSREEGEGSLSGQDGGGASLGSGLKTIAW